MLNRTSIRADIAELLCISLDEISDGDNLFEKGLDSLRLMTLLERWRDAGVRVSFVELAETPTLAGWESCLVENAGV